MATYKLTYFDVKGMCEPVRLLFSYGGIKFDDNRITRDDWYKIKSSTPFCQLPILEYNKKIATQSISICRYIAKQVKLNGKNDWEDLEIDAIVDTLDDLRNKLIVYFFADETEKEKVKNRLVNEILPFSFERFEEITKKNNGYLAVGRLTWADIFFSDMYDKFVFLFGAEVFSTFPNLIALNDNVINIPNIKKWLEERPKTDR